MKSNVSILFLGKKNDPYTLKALEFLRNNFQNVEAYLGEWRESFPTKAKEWRGDYVISYLSRWIVSDEVLKSAKIDAINFHPASPEYPGIGCNNFALYNNEKTYGATCHRMEAKVDTGDIIAVKRFPVFASDSVESLLERTYEHQLMLFYDVMAKVLAGSKLEPSGEKWGRKPYTRAEFNRLPIIEPNMAREEVARRIRATNFGPWKPYVVINGYVFEYKGEEQ